MSTMRATVANHATLQDELPLIHTSRCEHLASIAVTHELQPQTCPVFQESLIYLFYGRPAYRSVRGGTPGEAVVLCPVCFVFKPRTVSATVRRLFPCDTGAVAKDIFTPEIAAADLKALELDPKIASARKAVSLFFDTNGNYFLGRALAGKTFTPDSLEDRFYRLLVRPGPVNYDDRKSAIEVQVDHVISLRESLLFVVLPREFLEEPQVRNAVLNEWNCDPVTYATFRGAAPAEYYAVVRDRIAEHFERATRI